MSLSLTDIQTAKDDNELFERLSAELKEVFPPAMQEDRDLFIATLPNAPRGLRAMAGIFDLDVSMTLDDLAWHFGNHNDDRFLRETVLGLQELGATEEAEIFLSAWEIVKPFLSEIKIKDWDDEDPQDYFNRTGIQTKIDPLNDRMWAICKRCGDLGLMQYWLKYAGKYPERCVSRS